MIKIDRNRSECPRLLRGGYRWNNPKCKAEIVEALHIIQHGKCCYCEKKIGKGGQSQAVEHFRPRAPEMFPELENEWTNLLHACSCCNGNKSNNFPTDNDGNALLIDPTDIEVDPEDHLEYNVNFEDPNWGRVSAKRLSEDGQTSQYGQATIDTIGLDLTRKRHERVNSLRELIRTHLEICEAEIGQDSEIKRQKIRAFEDMLMANNKHAAFRRSYARAKELDSKLGIRITRGAQV